MVSYILKRKLHSSPLSREIYSSLRARKRSCILCCTSPAAGPDISNLRLPTLTLLKLKIPEPSREPSPEGLALSWLLLLLLSLLMLERCLRPVWRGNKEQLPVESDLRSEAGDLVAVLGVHVGQDGVCALLR